MKAEALIEANFNIKIPTLTQREFIAYYEKAIWLEKWRLQNLQSVFKNTMN